MTTDFRHTLLGHKRQTGCEPIRFHPDSAEYLREHKIGDVRVDIMNLYRRDSDPNNFRDNIRKIEPRIGFLDYVSVSQTLKATTSLETLAEVFNWEVIRQDGATPLYVARNQPIVPSTLKSSIHYIALSKSK